MMNGIVLVAAISGGSIFAVVFIVVVVAVAGVVVAFGHVVRPLHKVLPVFDKDIDIQHTRGSQGVHGLVWGNRPLVNN